MASRLSAMAGFCSRTSESSSRKSILGSGTSDLLIWVKSG
jgi:hypothetical protein